MSVLRGRLAVLGHGVIGASAFAVGQWLLGGGESARSLCGGLLAAIIGLGLIVILLVWEVGYAWHQLEMAWQERDAARLSRWTVPMLVLVVSLGFGVPAAWGLTCTTETFARPGGYIVTCTRCCDPVVGCHTTCT